MCNHSLKRLDILRPNTLKMTGAFVSPPALKDGREGPYDYGQLHINVNSWVTLEQANCGVELALLICDRVSAARSEKVVLPIECSEISLLSGWVDSHLPLNPQ